MTRRRQISGWERALERFAASPAGGWYFINVANKVDKHLVPATNGRFSTAVGQQVLVVETIGARTGAARRIPLVYVTDGDDIVLIASKGGAPKNPAWYHNLKANPEVQVWARDRTGRYRAREASGDERERLWDKAVDYYAGYETYQRRTGGRQIPVMVLTPISPGTGTAPG
jgi:deazaflavin-dependent oxidoreductase (nitroreductase family)